MPGTEEQNGARRDAELQALRDRVSRIEVRMDDYQKNLEALAARAPAWTLWVISALSSALAAIVTGMLVT